MRHCRPPGCILKLVETANALIELVLALVQGLASFFGALFRATKRYFYSKTRVLVVFPTFQYEDPHGAAFVVKNARVPAKVLCRLPGATPEALGSGFAVDLCAL